MHSKRSTSTKIVSSTLRALHSLFLSLCADGFPKFSSIAIALGALYMTVLAIELFGVTAAIMVSLRLLLCLSRARLTQGSQNKLLLIRIYSFLSALSALIVIAAAFTRVVIHFVFKVRVTNTTLFIAHLPFRRTTSSRNARNWPRDRML